EVDAEAAAELALPPPANRAPSGPVTLENAGPKDGANLAWRATSIIDQKQEGYVAAYIRLQLGDTTSEEMRALGRIADELGDGTVRLTIDQNILLPWVDKRSVPALYARLTAAGLARRDLHTVRDVTSCQGADTCNLAVTSSRQLAAAISDRLEKADAQHLAGLSGTVIKLSGCPNSCGQHHIADLGFHGAAKKDGGKTYPMYQLHLGGGVDGNGAYFGRQVVKIVARRVPEAVVRLLKLYESDRTSAEETPNAFFRRVDPKRVTTALADLTTGFAAGEEADIGEQTGFQVAIGEGECAA
ncbi:MAG: nitrite/sulfite reductase, partial [Polyangiales bacterium]